MGDSEEPTPDSPLTERGLRHQERQQLLLVQDNSRLASELLD